MATTIHDTSSDSTSVANASSLTISNHDTGVSGNDRLVVVTVTTQRNVAPTVTCGGNSMTEVVSSGTNRANIFTYEPEGVMTGNQNIVVSMSTSAIIHVAAYTLYDVDQTTNTLDTGGSNGTSASYSDTLTTDADGIVIDCLHHEIDDGSSMAADSGQVETINSNPNTNQTRLHTYKEASSSSESMGWGCDTSDAYCWAGVSFNPAAGGAPAATPTSQAIIIG